MGALNTPFDLQMTRFIEQWERVQARVDLASAAQDGGQAAEGQLRRAADA